MPSCPLPPIRLESPFPPGIPIVVDGWDFTAICFPQDNGMILSYTGLLTIVAQVGSCGCFPVETIT